MNKILKISLVTALFSGSLFADSYSHLDVKKECDVKANGIEKVIQTAEKYNEIAIKEKVEFMRFGMKASQYVQAVQDALKNGSKEIQLVDEKSKPTGEKVSIEFAAWRACSFGISALTQKEQSKKTWKLASPSDGYKY
ncbi:hypothetical protein ACN2EN_03420 [Aliarcobacter lanthieri]|uniref:hypothetical protein n=1 Tax=Aliarcobacter lanthieri TaxID=1355374 RepID=UPI00047EE602|nr:hypothetical protein [Aliarcobacter lanthieri]QKF58708.1 hypothetical protein ALANTH_0586 [Aliarcobacter lanthieri]